MLKTLIKVDFKTPPVEQPYLHNRWHPDIPMISWVKPGDQFRVECIDWTGGPIHDDGSGTDVQVLPLTPLHQLSRPLGVAGREAGGPSPLRCPPLRRLSTTPSRLN